MEQKLKLAEQAKDEFHKLTEELKKTLEDKEKEVRQAKEVAVLEYRDSDALIYSLFETNSLSLQAMLMTKGLMERSFHHETTL